MIRRPTEAPGAPEVSASIARAVDSILDILRDIPPAYRLQVLRIAESKIRPSIIESGELVRKVSKGGRASYFVTLPNNYTELVGEYAIQIKGKKLIYIPVEKGVARLRTYGGRLRLTIPKGAFEAIGSPSYVRVRVEDGRIVVEPA
ncbi:hypothetical protein Pdsh_02170 [Pyrodictium delaneyi]|uniref:Uncharacterized protein n=1 Tax=Pyrodictium delaneyi TaxID=1273541 RepID=A0A211YRD6_9CREN|nr:hypothetical protein Pdsh_02170 [Pyrodictium delaneyi]